MVVRFGNIMFYAEIQFLRTPESVSVETVGLRWLPELFCLGKPYFNGANYNGGLGFVKAAFAMQRYENLCGKKPIDIAHASEAVKAKLAGNTW